LERCEQRLLLRGPLENPAAAMLVRAFRQADLATGRQLLRQLGYEVGVEDFAGRLAHVIAAPDHRVAVAEHDGRVRNAGADLMRRHLGPAGWEEGS
jgi:hypothetical protein